MDCYVILEGGIHDGHSTKNVYLDKDKGIKEVIHLVNEYNQERLDINKRLNRNVNNTLKRDVETPHYVISYSNGVDFVALTKRKLIK